MNMLSYLTVQETVAVNPAKNLVTDVSSKWVVLYAYWLCEYVTIFHLVINKHWTKSTDKISKQFICKICVCV